MRAAELQAAAFLKRMDGRRENPKAFGADLVGNFKFVLQAAARFANDPRAPNLIALKPGFDAGQWRDSNDGLAGGTFPYDVNAVFVPAALDAAGRFFESGLLDSYLDSADRELFSRAKAMAAIWRDRAGSLFDVSVPNATARRDIPAMRLPSRLPTPPRSSPWTIPRSPSRRWP